MATYNGASYIGAQLQSFLDQTRLPDELVIIDDCSHDATLKIVEVFADKAPFDVIIIRNEKNLGYCRSFNAALMRTTGDLVFLSDQDDVWFAEKIAYMTELAEQYPTSLVLLNDAAITDGNINEVGLTKIGQIKSSGLSLDSFVMGCCCAIRRQLLNLCLPIPEGYTSHDAWIVRFADGLKAKKVEHRVLQYYRRHGNNESNFIANNTTKVTKYDRYARGLRKSLKCRNLQAAENEIYQQIILLNGIDVVIKSSDQSTQSLLTEYRSELYKSIETTKIHIQIRKRPLITRIPTSIKYWLLNRSFTHFALKNLVQDILG